jgi:hypothetical protein
MLDDRTQLAFMPAAAMPMTWKALQLKEPGAYSERTTPMFSRTAVCRPIWRFILRC